VLDQGMRFSWDEAKRLKTIEDRDLDFASVLTFFDGRAAIHQPTPRNYEDRWKTTAEIEGKFFTAVWLWRDGARHVISMRRAMTKRSKNAVSVTADDLKARQVRGQTRTDWVKAAARPMPSGADPDDAMEPIDWATTVLPVERPKIHASLRLDADVLEWFKAQGRGYQTRINAVLRGYYQQRSR